MIRAIWRAFIAGFRDGYRLHRDATRLGVTVSQMRLIRAVEQALTLVAGVPLRRGGPPRGLANWTPPPDPEIPAASRLTATDDGPSRLVH